MGVLTHALATLAEIFGSERILPATVSFVDIAGIVRGASEGQGLGKFWRISVRQDARSARSCGRSTTAMVHVDGKVSPTDDIETINTELIADLQTLEKAIPRLEKGQGSTRNGRRSSKRLCLPRPS